MELRSFLLENYEKSQKSLKMNVYASGNKAGKLLAQQITGQRLKSHIPYIHHPISREKVFNPQFIADAFSTYYCSLYNSSNKSLLVQPDSSYIQSFLGSVHLPCLSSKQSEDLNTPFSVSEIAKAK